MDQFQPSLFTDVPREAQSSQLTADSLRSLWHESFVHAGYESKVAADFDRIRGETLVVQFYEWWQKEERRVIGVEKGFKISMENASRRPARHPEEVRSEAENRLEGSSRSPQHDVIAGRFDRVEELDDGTLRIIDFKTFKVRSQEEVDQDLQLSLYALAAKEELKKDVSELVMLFLVDESLMEVVTTRGAGELRTAAKTIELLSERLESRDYAPTPSREKCRGCPFRRICDVAAV